MDFSLASVVAAKRRRGGLPAVAVLALWLTGCAALDAEPVRQAVAPDAARIRFESGEFDPVRTEHAVERDPRTGNEWMSSSFFGPNSQALVVLFKPGGGYVVDRLDLEELLDEALRTPPTWGEGGSVGQGPRAASYRRFELPGAVAACFAFQSVGHPDSADDRGRFRDLAFGYYCRDKATPDQTFRDREIVNILKRVEVAGRPVAS